MTDDWITTSEAATIAGVSLQAVHGWIARGYLTVVQDAMTQNYWMEADAFARFLAARQVATTMGVRIGTLRHWQRDDDLVDGG
jgi:DNA-binding transcriptional MerR regulator